MQMTLPTTMLMCVWLGVVMISALPAPAGATEVVHFSSVVLPLSAFKRRQAKAQGKELKPEPGSPLWGHIDKPDGPGPFPAVVLMHGCGGLLPTHARWASLLNKLGYVTLMLDSFRPRSVFNVCTRPVRIVSPSFRALDAYGALAYLQGLTFVDPKRIGLIGWSHGGTSALEAVNHAGITARLPHRFSAVVAFYPYCIEDRRFDLPVLILMGEADDWTPLSLCRKLKVNNLHDGTSIELLAYPGAHHAFDATDLQSGLSLKGVDGKAHWLQYNKYAH